MAPFTLRQGVLILLIFTEVCSGQQRGTSLPVTVSPAVVKGTGDGACPLQDAINAQRNSIKLEISNVLGNIFLPTLSCPCSAPGEDWTRIAHLDMTDPNQQCPTNWRLNIEGSIRGCGRTTGLCDSAVFPSNGRTYSRVCGKIIAYQRGSTSAFSNLGNSAITLEDAYIDGVSLTHGLAGSRRHIWTFANALYDYFDPSVFACPCTDPNSNWPYNTPPYVGDDYFCDTGNPGPTTSLTTLYSDDPLWDGSGCSSTSTCCQFNTPPYFCKALPQPTSDDIEIRICCDQPIIDEDVVITMVDIYIQ